MTFFLNLKPYLRQLERRTLVFVLLASFSVFFTQNSLAAEAQTPSNTEIKGSLVIIGGALRPDNDEVWKRVVAQAGGAGAKFVVISAASANPERAGKSTAAVLTRFGATAEVLPLSIKLKDTPYQEVVRDPKIIKLVSEANGVYFTGGDQGRITKVLFQADGTRTPLLEAIWAMYQRGGVIAGSSAGAAIMSSTMFYEAPSSVLRTLKEGITVGRDIAPGLGFIGDDVFVDQHLIIRGRFARMLPAMQKANYQLGLGIDENSAMVVSRQSLVEIIGYKGAILIDLRDAQTDSSIKDFNISNAKIGYLDRGDQFDLRTKVLIPSADKIVNKIDNDKPNGDQAVFNNDVLGNTTAVDLMFSLLDNKQSTGVGLAFGDGNDARPDLGFAFTFTRTKETIGYFSTASAEAYSAVNFRLDVRPIKVALPVFK
jgi:cyanophycinase